MLDFAIAILLLVILPARALWRSRADRPDEPRRHRYRATMAIVAGLLVLLAIDWWRAGRVVTALGLGLPTELPALCGLAAATVLLGGLALAIRRKAVPAKADGARTRSALLPEGAVETRLFVFFVLAVGIGWELLYRGFLLYYLPRHVGLPGAIVAAALAYGLAHGVNSRAQVAGSIAGAFAFTVGYAFTHSLWWLILLHVGLPLIGLAARRTLDRRAAVQAAAT